MALNFIPLSYSHDSGPMPLARIKAIILHDTEGYESNDLKIFRDGGGRGVSIHFYITRAGKVYQSVPMTVGANHAGFGKLPDGSNPNDHSLGIELEHFPTGIAYTEEQLDKLDELIAHIDGKLGRKVPIYGHKEIDPDRKSDPNGPFPMKEYKANRRHEPAPVEGPHGPYYFVGIHADYDTAKALTEFAAGLKGIEKLPAGQVKKCQIRQVPQLSHPHIGEAVEAGATVLGKYPKG